MCTHLLLCSGNAYTQSSICKCVKGKKWLKCYACVACMTDFVAYIEFGGWGKTEAGEASMRNGHNWRRTRSAPLLGKSRKKQEMKRKHKSIGRLHKMFPHLTAVKTNAGFFNGPAVRQILKDERFYKSLPKAHQEALVALEDVVKNFLGNVKAPSYVQLVEKLLEKFKEIGALMSLKMDFLKNHLQEFADNLGDFSDQHGERFHQTIKVMERT